MQSVRGFATVLVAMICQPGEQFLLRIKDKDIEGATLTKPTNPFIKGLAFRHVIVIEIWLQPTITTAEITDTARHVLFIGRFGRTTPLIATWNQETCS